MARSRRCVRARSGSSCETRARTISRLHGSSQTSCSVAEASFVFLLHGVIRAVHYLGDVTFSCYYFFIVRDRMRAMNGVIQPTSSNILGIWLAGSASLYQHPAHERLARANNLEGS